MSRATRLMAGLILISAGFFLSASPVDGTHASGMVALSYAGGVLLAVAVLTLAVGLLRKPATA
jgi:hypothetical protein